LKEASDGGVDKTQLGDHLSTLSNKRVREILNGIKLVLDPREAG
jgi:mRNA-degrading endonuclease toxin of MazEF toxin-antitoxin module